MRRRRRRSSARAPAGSGAERPKPGESHAITSKSAASRSITGRHACQWWPTPWSRISGGPSPWRWWLIEMLTRARQPYALVSALSTRAQARWRRASRRSRRGRAAAAPDRSHGRHRTRGTRPRRPPSRSRSAARAREPDVDHRIARPVGDEHAHRLRLARSGCQPATVGMKPEKARMPAGAGRSAPRPERVAHHRAHREAAQDRPLAARSPCAATARRGSSPSCAVGGGEACPGRGSRRAAPGTSGSPGEPASVQRRARRHHVQPARRVEHVGERQQVALVGAAAVVQHEQALAARRRPGARGRRAGSRRSPPARAACTAPARAARSRACGPRRGRRRAAACAGARRSRRAGSRRRRRRRRGPGSRGRRTFSATFGAATLIAAISVRAWRLPTVSISQAAFSVSRRAISISMRDSAIQSWMLPRVGQRLAERDARDRALAHRLERPLGGADRAHAVVDAPRAEARLGDHEAVALAWRSGSTPARARPRSRFPRGPRGRGSRTPAGCASPSRPGVSSGTRIWLCCVWRRRRRAGSCPSRS